MTSKWYSEILHEYTYTGHDFTHFYKDQLRKDLEDAGFVDVKVFYNYDPFILSSSTEEGAKRELLNHLVSLFGLKKFRERFGANEEVFYQEAEKIVRKCSDFTNCTDQEINDILKFKELTIRQRGGTFYAEMPRISLMATGVATRDY